MSTEIEEQIAQLEKLYRQLTGNPPARSEVPLAPIPAGVNPYEHVQERMRHLESLLQRLGSNGVVARPGAPRVSILESEESWACTAELPGVRKADLTVEVARGLLRISGRREQPRTEGEGMRAVYSEVASGQFERVVPLPGAADVSSLDARLDAGMLVVTCRKDGRDRQRERRIEVA
jgi:HSP20 family protein